MSTPYGPKAHLSLTDFEQETRLEQRIDAVASIYRSTRGANGAGSGVNVVAGAATNLIDIACDGCTIAGGGTAGAPNLIQSGGGAPIVSTIAGGYDNIISANSVGANSIGGGAHHRVSGNASHATISGGSYNNVTAGDYGTVSGGTGNTASANHVTISGGTTNVASANYTTVGGGWTNTASGAQGTVSGGKSNTASGASATVAGGNACTVASPFGSVGGGDGNSVTAAAEYAHVGGGLSNQVTQRFGAVPGGRSCLVSDEYGVASGREAVANHHGEHSQAGGMFSFAGDAQTSVMVLRRQSTSATPVELLLDGSSKRMTIADQMSWAFSLLIVARRTGATEQSAGYRVDGLIARDTGAATTAFIGVPVVTVLGESDPAWDVVATADTTNGALGVSATGAAGATINWVARATLTRVAG